VNFQMIPDHHRSMYLIELHKGRDIEFLQAFLNRGCETAPQFYVLSKMGRTPEYAQIASVGMKKLYTPSRPCDGTLAFK
jgi:hypothetical protein